MKCRCGEYLECGTCEHLDEIDELLDLREKLLMVENASANQKYVDLDSMLDNIYYIDEKLHERGYDI